MDGSDDEIGALRSKMDTVTMEMVRLFLERSDIAAKIGRKKMEIGMEITDESRESQLRQSVFDACKNSMQDRDMANPSMQSDVTSAKRSVTKFLNFLLDESIKIQTPAAARPATHLSMFAKAKEMEMAGRDIIHMEVGEPDFMPSSVVKDALAESYDTGRVRYGTPRGTLELLEGLAAYTSEKFASRGDKGGGMSPQNIMVTPGGRFAVYAAMSTLLNVGDEVIVIEPAWPAYRDCAMHIGAKIRAIKTTLEETWTPDISKIAQAINPSTKMIILNYPNNPTGRVLPPEMMDRVVDIASKHRLYVLSDEIYADYTSKPCKSISSYGYDRGIAVQSFSKSHAMTGMRIGYAMADTRVIGRMSALSALCLTSVSAPIQYAALKSLNTDTTKNAQTILERLKVLTHNIQQMGLDFVMPEGAMYLFARVPEDGASLAERMLEEYDTAVAPGVGFGQYHKYIRLSVAGADTDKLNKGTNRLKSMLIGESNIS